MANTIRDPRKQDPKNRKELIRALLKTPIEDIEQTEEFPNVLSYVCDETPEKFYENDKNFRKFLINKLTDWIFSEKINDVKSLTKIRDFLYDLTVIESRHDFYTFVKLTARSVMPNEFKDGRHIEVICKELQSIYESYADPDRKTERAMVFLPPRSMKSVLCSIMFPAWILGQNPKYRILLVGGSMQTAVDVFGRPLKNFLGREEYREIFPDTIIDEKVNSAQRFMTKAGGGYFCAGAGTGIAGRGGDFIICDDMLTEQNAFSKVERTKINMNYIPGIRSRSQPGAAELIVNTRWNLNDPSGFLLEVDKKSHRPWKVIKIPAILDEEGSKALRRKSDPKGLYEPGTSYWPEYKPLPEILELKQNYMLTEPYKWNALYMQNPVPEEGNIVKIEDWKWWKDPEPPTVSQLIVVLDTAFSEKERADYSAYTVWGIFHSTVETINGIQRIPNMIMLYADKGKWAFHDLCAKCEEIRVTWKPDYFVIEKKQSGLVLLQELFRRGFPLIDYDPRGSKEERLQAASTIMKAGRVWVPEGNENDPKEWAMDVVDETCNFPSAPHDDYADTVSMAVIWMRDNGRIEHEAYDYENEDDVGDGEYESFKTYWGSLLGSH